MKIKVVAAGALQPETFEVEVDAGQTVSQLNTG
jgi:hypothetical protein